MRIRVSLGVLVAMASLVACGGGGDGDTDASVDSSAPDAATGCTSDDACRDDDFCNGEERCVEGACVPGDGPCGAGTVCDPTNRRCELGCTTDADGDGAIARSCGGTDCDDEDASRHPGATEVCDDEAVDEDCDPTTFGGRDDDGDGYEDARCCNDVAGFARCGTDCDDTSASVQPGSPEVCDDVDTDCDGSVDEGVSYTLYVDEDRDGFGDSASSPERACRFIPGRAIVGDDCNDGDESVSPGARDVCNGVDDDCDGSIDEDAETLCRDALGIVEAACAHLEGEDAPRCVVTSCEGSRYDCNLDPSDGCEADVCTDLAHCSACGGFEGTCDFGFCDRGRCAPSATGIGLASGRVLRDRDGVAIEGAVVSRVRDCRGEDRSTSDVNGVYTTFWGYTPRFVLMRTEAAGYVTQIDAETSWGEIRLLEESELATILDASPVPVDRRLGVVIVDAPGGIAEIVEPIAGVYRAPVVPGTRYDLPLGDRVRRVFVNVRPGKARIRAGEAGDSGTTTSCSSVEDGPADSPIWHDVEIRGDAIVHVPFGYCSGGRTGG
ncbi:MAG: putative metal-binding motif-containing protein [Sandaracinus sp.]|nr:putative metal-binding motif-containing protein [Sandaracinus sp.]MCB9622373.1 putative metal-binding motif-containing protein [Sandaracinus sp.]